MTTPRSSTPDAVWHVLSVLQPRSPMHHADLASRPAPQTLPADFLEFCEVVAQHNAQASQMNEDPLGPPTIPAPRPPVEKKLVLVVDDDVDLCSKIEESLQRHGYVPHIEYDGIRAIEWMREDYMLSQFVDAAHPRQPALILVDWELPARSAFGLIHHLQIDVKTRAIEVLILASHPSDTPWVLELTAEHYDEDRLIEAVRKRVEPGDS